MTPTPDVARPQPPDGAIQAPELWPDLRDRIELAARRAYDHEQAMRVELERRDDLIVEAYDHGAASVADVAKAARMSTTNVYRIVGAAG